MNFTFSAADITGKNLFQSSGMEPPAGTEAEIRPDKPEEQE
jgi:hypothetical protein